MQTPKQIFSNMLEIPPLSPNYLDVSWSNLVFSFYCDIYPITCGAAETFQNLMHISKPSELSLPTLIID